MEMNRAIGILSGKLDSVVAELHLFKGEISDIRKLHETCPIRSDASLLLSLPPKIDRLERNMNKIAQVDTDPNIRMPKASDFKGFKKVLLWGGTLAVGGSGTMGLVELVKFFLDK